MTKLLDLILNNYASSCTNTRFHARFALLQWPLHSLGEVNMPSKMRSHPSRCTSTVNSGIPQGSVLGPILFVLFINDLPESVSCTVMIFTDDTNLFSMVSDIQVYKQLREDLDKLLDWSETWQLHFNQGKM